MQAGRKQTGDANIMWQGNMEFLRNESRKRVKLGKFPKNLPSFHLFVAALKVKNSLAF